ncbi:long-chain-fatty-acid-CoA ligase [Pyrenophora tritici-repentis Pt-1C-BFP]|uniref:Long-chain-fatty-acid-CoA ligase n=1 Tax=Pyrenophora tritici-repentis (strain Pt-1C-BFP) TaxID=426418 RepID=B2VV56_PYRTR|nr:long-chain-fatty-acid-CoA ligase [Pyrenophora tritici-repentis Pt-1C-BFP]EDU41677.1 long-chain-fatty-acid-CoA ligase [Pyrenophora tritici-repentis Pt-1C-BFP]
MPFYPPSWVPKLPFDPPDSIPISEFILNDIYGRHPLGYSHNPFTCGLTGKTYTALEVQERVDYLARGLAKELGFDPNKGSEWDKVIAVFSVNTIDTVPLAWATTRLGGIHTPANAGYSASELEYQLKTSGAKALFTCVTLLETARIAAKNTGIPENRIYILEVPEKFAGRGTPEGLKTVDHLIREGGKLDRLPPLDWEPGHGAKRTAYLCYSSGTSGLPCKTSPMKKYTVIPSSKTLVTPEGEEITGYDQPGELLIKSPSVVLGYHNNEKANAETFQDGWLRTGDEALFRKAPSGHEHLFIVDRIKELIKVQGYQVAPAELEAHLLSHPMVKDCAVIQVPNEKTGEVPKAFVVKASSVGLEDNDRLVARDITKYVEQHKARYKWLGGGVEFVDEIPKSPSGKILRRLLRDCEKEKRRQAGSKL